jgi:hypothetical protein
LNELKRRKTIFRDLRSKNKGRIEELENIINKINSGNLKDDSD